ncbi:MAG: hypothetical protein PF574_09025 [Candidatus Delongbacteria bacterium]|jgi:hypothetical protein|nr:hypothetical protein [Candidatus Delongbacteria bacterium]
MKREYLFILITIAVAISGLIYKGMFVSDTLNETQTMIIENNDQHAKFIRDTIVQRNCVGLTKIYEINKRDDRNYGEIIAELLKKTEDIFKESRIEYDVNDINQEQQDDKNINWRNGTETFYINVDFRANYTDLIRFINIIEENQLLININLLNYFRARPTTTDRTKKILDEFSFKTPLDIKISLEYIKFL